MKRTRRTTALAVAAVVAIGGGQAVAAGGGPKDFNAIANVVDAKVKGDTAIFKEKLKVGGKKAGKAKIKLSYSGSGAITFTGNWRFDNGTVKAKDKLESKHDHKVKIVRGTGIYAGAKGMVTIKSISKKRNRESFNFK